MGAWAAEIFQEHGGKVVAVSDAGGAIANEAGLDILALRRHLAAKNPLSTFVDGALISWARRPIPPLQLRREKRHVSVYCLGLVR